MLSFTAACLWFIAANLRAMFPSQDHHWQFAYAMIGVGIPILGWVTYDHGPLAGLLLMAAAASMLRWPLVYLWRWFRGRLD